MGKKSRLKRERKQTMLLDVTQPLIDIKTKKAMPFKTAEGLEKDGIDEANPNNETRIKDVAFSALVNTYKGEESLSGEVKFKRGKLAEKIFDAEGEIEVTEAEIKQIKECIGKGFGIGVMTAAYNAIGELVLAQQKPAPVHELKKSEADKPNAEKPVTAKPQIAKGGKEDEEV